MSALETARLALAAAEQATGVHAVPDLNRPQLAAPFNRVLPGGLPRGAAITVAGSTTVLLTLLASAGRAWRAVVGWPEFGLLSALDAGWNADELALVPEPGSEVLEVVAALLDGLDQVILGPRLPLTASDLRRLIARAREREVTLVLTRSAQDVAAQVHVERVAWSGVDVGSGWIRSCRARLTSQIGNARPRRLEITVPVGAEHLPYESALRAVP